jgi:AhpD family alkylhydroperoxidase
MQPGIDSPVMTAPGALEALQRLAAAAKNAGLPQTTLLLVALRASQINSCSVCVDMHSRELKAAGEPDERILTVAAWREASVLRRGRARRAGADRGHHPPRRSLGPGSRRCLGGGRPALRRSATRGARAHDRRDQRLEPHQRHHPAPRGGTTGASNAIQTTKRLATTNKAPSPPPLKPRATCTHKPPPFYVHSSPGVPETARIRESHPGGREFARRVGSFPCCPTGCGRGRHLRMAVPSGRGW